MADADLHQRAEAFSLGNVEISWDDIRAFLAVVVHGSLRAAAGVLGESQATIGRRVARLEAQLGFPLTRRGPNRTELTDAGLDLFRMVSPMAAAASEAETVRRLHAPQPHAPLRITATTSMSMFLSYSMPALRTAIAPRELLLLPSRRQLDLERGEADIALRMSKNQQGTPAAMPPANARELLLRRLATIRFAIYGVAGHERLPMIMTSGAPQVSRQHALSRIVAAMRSAGPEIDEMHLRYLAVKSGVGIGILPCWLGDTDASLVRVFAGDEHTITDEIYLVRHARSRADAGVERAAKVLTKLFREKRPLLAGEQ